jgi:hypothetical protein
MYAYGVNNPLFYSDPDGKDAIAVGFTKEIPIVGHVGLISLHLDGTAIYSRYGPVTPGTPVGPGQPSSFILPKVTFDQFGNPTQASFQALTKVVAQYEGQSPNTVRMAFFKTSEADTIALDNWIREQSKRNSIFSKYYSFWGNSCANFCERGLMVARAPVDLTPMSSIPNFLILDLQVFSDSFYNGDQQPQQQQQEPPTSVTSDFCYTEDNGNQVCQ